MAYRDMSPRFGSTRRITAGLAAPSATYVPHKGAHKGTRVEAPRVGDWSGPRAAHDYRPDADPDQPDTLVPVAAPIAGARYPASAHTTTGEDASTYTSEAWAITRESVDPVRRRTDAYVRNHAARGVHVTYRDAREAVLGRLYRQNPQHRDLPRGYVPAPTASDTLPTAES
jgi:hypothetical protein